MSCPLVSVGMPVYNGEKWLRRSLNSLLAQDYPNIEIIISDNASQDSTHAICTEYKAKNKGINIIKQDATISVLENFKAVLSAAQGRYFMWAAVDDSRDPSFIRRLVGKLESDARFVVAQSATMLVSESKLEKIGFVRFDGANNPEKCSRLRLTKKIVSPLKYNYFIYGIFRREVLTEAFAYCPRIPSSDRWFLLQLPLAGYRFGYIDEPLYIRTIADSPLYVRYPNEELGRLKKRLEDKWFRFEALPVVRKMLEKSSLLSSKQRIMIYIVLFQLWREKVLDVFRCMMQWAVNKFFPWKLLALLRARRERIRQRNLQF